MAIFKIRFKRSAQKDLKKLEKDLIQRILKSIEDLLDDPAPRNSKKLKGGKNFYRIWGENTELSMKSFRIKK